MTRDEAMEKMRTASLLIPTYLEAFAVFAETFPMEDRHTPDQLTARDVRDVRDEIAGGVREFRDFCIATARPEPVPTYDPYPE